MSEKLSPSINEVLRPTITPEMGFQSYELLAGDVDNRERQQAAFFAGEVRNPTFDYPLIDKAALERGIRKLDGILAMSRDIDDKLVADVVWDSAAYRMAEMYWLMEAERLNALAGSDATSSAFHESADRFQELNEQLYGIPHPELAQHVYGEIMAQAQFKELDTGGHILLDELINGASVQIGDETVQVPGIGDKGEGRLPSNVPERLKVLGEVLRDDCADVFAIVEQYWEGVVAPRSDKAKKAFATEDMKALFEAVHALHDPENASKISVLIHHGSTQLAWDTSSMSIRIGESRKPIEDKTEMAAKIIHEYYVHALRAVNGLKSKLPVLGTGVYSEADQGERSDYLTFEEGFASLCEIAIDGEFTDWKPLHVSRYLAALSAYEGADFRQAFETNWRARVLMSVQPGKAITPELIDKEKKQAYISVARMYRGTPTQLTDRPVLSFNKDLAYLEGKVDGLEYLERVGDDKEAIRTLFRGKFDPNNHRQAELVARYAVNGNR